MEAGTESLWTRVCHAGGSHGATFTNDDAITVIAVTVVSPYLGLGAYTYVRFRRRWSKLLIWYSSLSLYERMGIGCGAHGADWAIRPASENGQPSQPTRGASPPVIG